MHLAFIFENLGPYHVARLNACSTHYRVTAIELKQVSSVYAWERTSVTGFERRTLSNGASTEAEIGGALVSALSDAAADLVFVPGWQSRSALVALDWCGRSGTPCVVMSESQYRDVPRRHITEFVKKLLLRCSAGALVGGSSHVEYIVSLGVKRQSVATGYDVVDNDYFYEKSNDVRRDPETHRQRLGLPRDFVLASARFVKKKNLGRLIEAYAGSRGGDCQAPHLVLLGDGPLRGDLESQISGLGVTDFVHMPGFVQYPELPTYYALAKGFVHASTSEQWGLVVNEAMASALPVVVSNACGCAEELVVSGRNGWTFDPGNTSELERLLRRLYALPGQQVSEMGKVSRAIIGEWSPSRFSQGVIDLATKISQAVPRRYGVFDRCVNAFVQKFQAAS